MGKADPNPQRRVRKEGGSKRRERLIPIQSEFSRDPPTAEDDYFREEELSRKTLKKAASPKSATRSAPAALSRWDQFMERWTRALQRWFNTSWRP